MVNRRERDQRNRKYEKLLEKQRMIKEASAYFRATHKKKKKW